MREMIKYELKKVMSCQKARLVFAMLVLVIAGAFVLIYASWHGKEAQEKLTYYSGSLDDEKFQKIKEEYETLQMNYPIQDENNSQEIIDKYMELEYPLWLMNCDLIRKENLAKIDVEADTLVVGDTMFYAFMEDFIANYAPFIFTFILALLLAPIFSGEYERKMDGLILSSKYGKSKLIGAKFMAAAIIVIAMYCFILCVYALISVVIWGVGSLDASFVFTGDYVFNYISSPYNFMVWEYMLISMGVSLLGCLGYGAFILFVSSKCKNSLVTSMISLLVAVVPFLVYKMIGMEDGTIIDAIRFTYGNIIGVRSLFSGYYPLELSEISLPVPLLNLLVLLVSSVMFIILSYRTFRRHQLTN